ncbi:MAG: type I DNA topoisomerase, partial [Thermoleophilia bacterium]|nr:type I DNA topoisomerase [Thermoleophilia bacterium]
IGHIRDLPTRASDIPMEDRGRFGALGVAVEEHFEPYYVVDPDKKRVVADLRKKLKEADELLLATDEDREGEAIAWHLLEELKPRKGMPVRRMVFHEITKDAIARALEQTRDIDEQLVDAQETRRILDRLYGFEVSPVLWKKVTRGLSAGRVQSVATRLVVERERERMRFVVASYWDVVGTFDPGGFEARLVMVDGARVAQGRDFGSDGAPREGIAVLDEQRASALARGLAGRPFSVRSVEEKPYTRRPAAPFRTSTLQQEASRKLRFSSQTTMRVAQRLYENGYITYMRTDSVTLSDSALAAARSQAAERYGAETVPAAPRKYERAVANAQEAHEAIRPAGEVFRTPEQLQRELSRDEHALYDLIWKRTLASQMKDASGQTVSIRLGATTADGDDATFAASGTVITFPGFLLAYESGRDEPSSEDDEERRLPKLREGQELESRSLEAVGHETSPPARFTEASLVKALEDRGIGRPSTYASIMGTILDRGYVFKKGTAMVPTFLAFAVTQLLEEHFARLVDYDFTARLEDDLDRIAAGDEQRVEWLRRFYFGDGGPGLRALVTEHLDEIDAREVNRVIDFGDGMELRVGRYGPFLQRGEDRASVPDDLAPDELTAEVARELLERPTGDRELGVDPATGRIVVARQGRYGPYVAEVLAEGEEGKPRTGSLLASMSIETVSLDDALRLLSLPRSLEAPDGEEIVVANGRFGPYVKKGAETRSLADEDELFTITSEQALELLAKPKARRGRGAPKPPLRELGADPGSGRQLVVKDGRFGPYVTDGETNASLRKGDDVESLTMERAVELLADRRARGPAKRTTRRRSR